MPENPPIKNTYLVCLSGVLTYLILCLGEGLPLLTLSVFNCFENLISGLLHKTRLRASLANPSQVHPFLILINWGVAPWMMDDSRENWVISPIKVLSLIKIEKATLRVKTMCFWAVNTIHHYYQSAQKYVVFMRASVSVLGRLIKFKGKRKSPNSP